MTNEKLTRLGYAPISDTEYAKTIGAELTYQSPNGVFVNRILFKSVAVVNESGGIVDISLSPILPMTIRMSDDMEAVDGVFDEYANDVASLMKDEESRSA